MTWDVSSPVGITLGALPHQSGRFYDSRVGSTLTTLALAANTLYATPFYVPVTTTYTAISIEVTTLAVGKNVRMGIYNDGGAGAPTTLLLDAGTVLTTTTGGKTITISQSLAAGWYWLAGVSDGTASVRATSQTSSLAWLGFTSGTDTTFHVGYSIAFTYGVLSGANPFGAGALMTTAAPRFMLGV